MSVDAEAAEPSVANLTAFKRDVLWVLKNGGEMKGLAILRTLEDYYEKPVNHGQIYPNLDDLVDADLIEKEKLDGRTNGYSLTEAGRRALTSRKTWETSPFEESSSEADTHGGETA